jgi:hypothetical protein
LKAQPRPSGLGQGSSMDARILEQFRAMVGLGLITETS